MKKQSGQTLIETIAAIFILTTALTAGLALTIYVLANSEVNENELVATELAREGVEVVRMMRDTNWLAWDAKGGAGALQSCSDLPNSALCYQNTRVKASGAAAYNNNYDLANGSYRLQYDSTKAGTPDEWALQPPNAGSYDLYLQANGTFSHLANSNSIYSRKIVISDNHAAPFTNQNSNQEIIVKSTVAWHSKACVWSDPDPDNAPNTCRITVEDHLTNWKDYQ
jgi:type II secretory pathway pseudopilin PulG